LLKSLSIENQNKGVSTGNEWLVANGEELVSISPVDGKPIASVRSSGRQDYQQVVDKAQEAFSVWRLWPAPKRGEVVRQIGHSLRKNKEALGRLVSFEMGKSLQEGYGEVQEMIDICDFAVG